MARIRSVRRAALVLAAVGLTAAALAAAPAAQASPPSNAQLAAALTAIDKAAPFGGTAWGVDNASHRVVVSVDSTVRGAKLARVNAAVQRLGGLATLRTVAGTFHVDISGGDAIYGTQYRCSLGFNVVKGSAHYFLTAGHCGNVEPRWWTSATRTTLLGSTVGSTFPGKDYALVQYAASYTNYPGTVGSQDITHSANAFVGENVTRRGSTTGVHTGRVTALNVTVHYSGGGTVRGLIQTTVCAEGGDSGGPLYDGTAAVGLTSGGSGDCKSGGTTFFQPVTTALSAYGVQVY